MQVHLKHNGCCEDDKKQYTRLKKWSERTTEMQEKFIRNIWVRDRDVKAVF